MNSFTSALKSMRRNLTMTSASILLVTLTLLVVGFVFQVSYNTASLTESVLDSLKVYAYVDTTATKKDEDAIKKEVEDIKGVEKIKYSSKEDELESLTSTLGENGDAIQKSFSGNANPLNDVFIISIDLNKYDLEKISKEVAAIDNVESVDYGQSNGTNDFIQMMKLVKSISIFVAGVLVIVSLFIITNTIKLTITARRTEIEIMRLVGATKMYIRLPFMVEGMIIGLVGGLISFIALHFFYAQMYAADALLIIKPSLVTVGAMDQVLFLSLPIIGMVIGTIGSYVAMRRYLEA